MGSAIVTDAPLASCTCQRGPVAAALAMFVSVLTGAASASTGAFAAVCGVSWGIVAALMSAAEGISGANVFTGTGTGTGRGRAAAGGWVAFFLGDAWGRSMGLGTTSAGGGGRGIQMASSAVGVSGLNVGRVLVQLQGLHSNAQCTVTTSAAVPIHRRFDMLVRLVQGSLSAHGQHQDGQTDHCAQAAQNRKDGNAK